MCHKCPKPSKVVVCQPSTEQKTKKTLFAGDWEDEQINFTGCSGGVCVSTVEQGGVARAEFSTDVTFSQWFCFLINVCSSSRSLLCLCERNAVLQGTIAFESCNSVFVGEKNIFYLGGGGGGGRRERQEHFHSSR